MPLTIQQHFAAVQQPQALRNQLVQTFDRLENTHEIGECLALIRKCQAQDDHHLMFVFAACSRDQSVYAAWLQASCRHYEQLWQKVEEAYALKQNGRLQPLLLKYAAALMDRSEAVSALHQHMQSSSC